MDALRACIKQSCDQTLLGTAEDVTVDEVMEIDGCRLKYDIIVFL